MLTPTAIHTVNSFLSRTIITELDGDDIDSDDIIRFHITVLLTAIQTLHEQQNISYSRITDLIGSFHTHSESVFLIGQPQNTPWKLPSTDDNTIETLLEKGFQCKWTSTWQWLCARHIRQHVCSDTDLIIFCKVISNNLTPNWPYRHHVHNLLMKYLRQKHHS